MMTDLGGEPGDQRTLSNAHVRAHSRVHPFRVRCSPDLNELRRLGKGGPCRNFGCVWQRQQMRSSTRSRRFGTKRIDRSAPDQAPVISRSSAVYRRRSLRGRV
jgi:hypothetical protein